MEWDHIIKNGTIVTSREQYKANIYVKDEKIAAISSVELPGDAREITDANGKYVLPGFIETHVHSRDGRKGAYYKEDFFHSSMAGVVGGVTTLFEMPNCNPAIYNVENMNDLISCITPKAHLDFGVWALCLGNLNKDQIIPLAEAGVVGFKFFWGYAIDSKTYQLIYNYEEGMKDVIPPLDDGEIYKIFREVQKTGKLLGIHAENFALIKMLTAEVKASGDKSYEAMLRSRPPVSELTVIETGILFAQATGAHLHIHHLASGDGVELIRDAQKKNIHVTAETCTHYLELSNEDYDRVGPLIKGYPPIRLKRDQELLWDGLRDGTLSYVCSDHAPHSYEEKMQDLWTAPAGMANIETMAPVMINAVNEGKITLNQLVQFLSENQAKQFGFYPQKGSLEVGTDADIVVVDLDKEYVLDQEKLHSRTKLTPFHGRKMKGLPVQTILRGKTVAKDGEVVSEPCGKFVRPL
ncbi:dihydroorotase [Flexilinea flocculi]|jgi:dihydroorotase/allantoinase|uniref:Dihydroorotase, multifunctional complex type n=1 Tax=Flexilinea flocculi TaxID=1678840 RepID=A0A0K8PB20_9CHLR|nr:dihydroorotase [Flexilinea flocculi]GAP39858.1 dihydroorotase, multifunctional complex type [Flexilinea flocculi]